MPPEAHAIGVDSGGTNTPLDDNRGDEGRNHDSPQLGRSTTSRRVEEHWSDAEQRDAARGRARAQLRRPRTDRPPGARRRPEPTTSGGPATTSKILVRAYLCGQCGSANLPSRVSCKTCGTNRNYSEARRDDWWLPDKLPIGAELEADGGAASTERPQPRIPGLPPQGPPQRQQKQQRQQQPQRPPAARPKALLGLHNRSQRQPRQRNDGRHDNDYEADYDDGEESTWSQVVSKRKRRNQKLAARRGSTSSSLPPNTTTKEFVGDEPMRHGPQEDRGMPPPREFDVPQVPRTWLVQLAHRAESKVQQARDAELRPEMRKRREEEAEPLAKLVRQAGGPTPQTLANNLRAERQNVDKSDRAIRKVREKINELESEITRMQDEILRLRTQEQRHVDRKDTAIRRSAYLASQAHAESLPSHMLESLRENLAHAQRQQDPRLQTMVAICAAMVTPSELQDSFNLAADDSSSSEDEQIGSDTDVQGAEGRPPHAGLGQVHAELEDAIHVRDLILQAQATALSNAKAHGNKKRLLGGDMAKNADGDGDDDMVPLLTPQQIESNFAQRLAEAEDEVQRLQAAIAEVVPAPPADAAQDPPAAPAAAGATASIAAQPAHTPSAECEETAAEAVPTAAASRIPEATGDGGNEGQRPPGDTSASREDAADGPPPAKKSTAIAARMVTAEFADAQAAASEIQQVREPQRLVDAAIKALVADTNELQRIVEADEVIIEQSAMQQQQDLEAKAIYMAEQIHGLAATDQQKQEARIHCFQVLRAGTAADTGSALAVFGPTGAPLGEQQSQLRMANSSGSGGGARVIADAVPRRRSRWDPSPPPAAPATDAANVADEEGRSGRGARSKSPRGRDSARATATSMEQ